MECSDAEQNASPAPDWLIDGGETGELIRSVDWSATPLGPRQSWPQCLRVSLNLILASSFPMAICWGDDLLCLYNDAYCTIARERHPHAMGQPLQAVWPDLWDRLEPIIQRVMSRGETVHVEDQHLRVVRPDGVHDACCIVSHSPLRTDTGQVGGVLIAFVDTTERVSLARQTEIALHQTEQYLRLFVDHAPAAVAMFDREMRYLVASKRWLTDYGLGEQNVIGRSHYEVLPEISERCRDSYQRCLAGAVERRDEDTLARADGKTDWVRWEILPWRDADGQIGGIIMFTEIITQRKLAEQTLRDSEHRLKLATEATGYGTFDYCPQTDVGFWSAHTKRCFGLSPDAHLNYDLFLKALHPDDRDRIHRLLQDNFKPGSSGFCQAEYRTIGIEDGKERWVSATGQAYFDDAGRCVRFIGSTVDITDRKRFEDALRFLVQCGTTPAEDFFHGLARYLAQNLSMDYVCIDRFQPGSLTAHPLAVYSDRKFEDSVSHTLKDTVCGDIVAKTICCFPQGVRHQFPQDIVLQSMQAESCIGTTLWNSHGLPVGLIAMIGRQPLLSPQLPQAILQMVGVRAAGELERREAEEAMAAARLRAEQATAVAEAANRAKDDFLAVLSHELRNPLSPVLVTASMLRDDPRLDSDVRQQLEVICRNAELEARLIDDLLDITRIERGKVELDRRPVELSTIIHHATEVCLPDIEARRLQFAVDLGTAPYMVDADTARLQEVFWNLLRNAVKFTPPGGCVSLRCHRDADGFVVAQISDTGEGIDPAALDRIFNAFEQAERSITRQFGGLGLGLTITKALVELHGGTIRASSPGKGKGATFTIRLPLLPTQPCESAFPASSTSAPVPSSPTTRPLRILLVEDHGDTARIMRRLLTADGHDVKTAADVATGLRLAQQSTFDLMLSDLGLPDGSGLDLMRSLRGMGINLPAIALSGYGQERDMQATRDAGFLAHLVKPVAIAKLREHIAAAMGMPCPRR